jgi:hypothetical protein
VGLAGLVRRRRGDRVLYWVSRPTSVHSQNIAARTDLSVVVFDTNARVGEAQAV